jgi:hypothetical protein
MKKQIMGITIEATEAEGGFVVNVEDGVLEMTFPVIRVDSAREAIDEALHKFLAARLNR